MTAARWEPVVGPDGHHWQVLVAGAETPRRVLVWLPALGVPARHYEAFASELAARGTAVVVHEWRGLGSSSLRASRTVDWGYRELLTLDIATTRTSAARLFPRAECVIGGHSLGGQLASLTLALDHAAASELWLVASGSPWFRLFPAHIRPWLPTAYRLMNLLAKVFGVLPGRRIGFGGQEAAGVINDWHRTGLTGHYAARGLGDLEPGLRSVRSSARAVLLSRDWLAPRKSLHYLLSKMKPSQQQIAVLDSTALGAPADHFAWMKSPTAVIDALLADQFGATSGVGAPDAM